MINTDDMDRSNYKRLGDYIRSVDVRNRDLAVTNLLGVSISKTFIPSIANTIGTDMSTYKVVEPYQFAYGPVTSRNGDKITFALYKGTEKCIISQAYETFEIIDKEQLDPDYLMMWALRPEFDRYARFKSNGSAREIFSWDEMCEVYLPVPDIAIQRRIVAEYQAVEKRIATNEQLIAKHEETAQTIYKKMFVDDIDPAHLPDGWKQGTLSDLGVVVTGKTPSSEYPEDFGKDVPFLTPGDFHPGLKYIDYTERNLSIGGAQKLASKMLYKNDVAVTCIGYVGKVVVVPEKCITNQQINSIRVSDPNMSDFAYYYLCSITQELENAAVGSSTLPLLNKSAFELIHCPIPPQKLLNEFYEKIKPINSLTLSLEKENVINRTLLELHLSKMSK